MIPRRSLNWWAWQGLGLATVCLACFAVGFLAVMVGALHHG